MFMINLFYCRWYNKMTQFIHVNKLLSSFKFKLSELQNLNNFENLAVSLNHK